MSLDIVSLSQPPSMVAENITDKQSLILQVAMKNDGVVSWNQKEIVFSPCGEINKSVFYRLRDMGLLQIESGGRHGGSHKAYCYLTGKGRAVANFIDT